MRVFITGGTGLIGSAVVAELLAAGHSVTALTRSEASAAKARAGGADTVPGSHSCTEEYRQCSSKTTHPRRTGLALHAVDLLDHGSN